MAFKFDGVTVTEVWFNGVELSELYYNDVLVFEGTPSTPQTPQPEIESQGCVSIGANRYISYYVRNNQPTLDAVIYSEISDTTPDVNQGSIAAGQLTSQILVGPYPADRTYTIYATAHSVGQLLSTVDIESVGTTFCIEQ